MVEMLTRDRFVIQWYEREGRGRKFKALVNDEGGPSVQDLDLEMIMFWGMSENRQGLFIDTLSFISVYTYYIVPNVLNSSRKESF